MNPQAAQTYLRTKVLTATPEQLQLMLYDGAIRFGEQARMALTEKNYEKSYSMISRVQKIITEMASTLRHDVYPELCGKLSSLYNYVYRRLIEATTHRSVEALEEAINLLKYQRQTWTMLLDQLGKQKAAAAAQTINMPAPDSRMEASISMRG